MKKYEGYIKSCNVLKINETQCNIAGMLSIDKNYRIFFEFKNLTKEQHSLIENAKFLNAKSNDKYITACTMHFLNYSSVHNHSDKISTFNITIEAENIFWGDEFIEINNEDIFFEGFSCHVTAGNELIGITPYQNMEEDISVCNVEGTFNITSQIKTLSDKNELRFFTYPHIRRKDMEIRLGFQSVIQYQSESIFSLYQINEKLSNLILLFKILCGEYVSTTSVILFNNKKSYDYIGNCNFPKYELLLFKNNTFDRRYFLRKGLFKISDFNNLDTMYQQWEQLINQNTLTFKIYRELLLDEEKRIFSVNKFLKVMQIIEGIERESISEDKKIEFEQHKENIIESLSDEDDKEFIRKCCEYKGDNFRKCLKNFVHKGIQSVTELSNTKCTKYSKAIIEKVKNDRDTYTHASHYSHPSLSEQELLDIIYVFNVFFRIKILSNLGIDKELIRKRLSFDRKFESHFENLFQLKIKINKDYSFDTGEFDKFMWGFD